MNEQEKNKQIQSISELRQEADTCFTLALAHKMQLFSSVHLAKGELAKSVKAHPWRWVFATTGALFAVKILAKPVIRSLPYLAGFTRFSLGIITGEKVLNAHTKDKEDKEQTQKITTK